MRQCLDRQNTTRIIIAFAIWLESWIRVTDSGTMGVDQESADKSAAAAARADEMPIDAKLIVSISMIILRKLLAQKVLCFSKVWTIPRSRGGVQNFLKPIKHEYAWTFRPVTQHDKNPSKATRWILPISARYESQVRKFLFVRQCYSRGTTIVTRQSLPVDCSWGAKTVTLVSVSF